MGVDEVITLDDGKEYVLLSQSIQENQKYFLAAELVAGNLTENYSIFKEIQDADGYSVEEVTDETITDALIDDFESQYDAADAEEETL